MPSQAANQSCQRVTLPTFYNTINASTGSVRLRARGDQSGEAAAAMIAMWPMGRSRLDPSLAYWANVTVEGNIMTSVERI